MKANLCVLFVLLVLLPAAHAQTNIEQLEKQRQKTLEQLEMTNQMLEKTKKSQSNSLHNLNILNRNISERKKLINNMSSEINLLDDEMTRLNRETRKLNDKLGNLKTDYARLVEESRIYSNVYSKMMFVLSARNFRQSFRRFRYLHEFTDYRENQIKDIEQTKTLLAMKADSLITHKTGKQEIVKQQEMESRKLTQDQRTERSLYNALAEQKNKLQATIKTQQRQAEQLNNRIEQLIAEEIRKAEERAKEAAKNNAKQNDGKISEGVAVLTKEQQLVSGNFEANKGRLPWPVAKGYISGYYGVQRHPVHEHVTVNNKGIYIQTPVGSDARAVFDGTVTQSFAMPGSGNAIIIQHGEYRSVYSNLSDIYVKVGDKIKAKQAIGKIYTDSETGSKTEIYFQVRKGLTLLNPETWIAK